MGLSPFIPSFERDPYYNRELDCTYWIQAFEETRKQYVLRVQVTVPSCRMQCYSILQASRTRAGLRAPSFPRCRASL